MLEARLQDLRYAARTLRQAKGFTAAAVVTLGLGIGANSAVFTVAEAALLRGLPYRDADRIVHLWETTAQRNDRQVSYPDFSDVRDRGRAFDAVAGYAFEGFSISAGDGAEYLPAARVSANFLTTLGVEPILGRGFRPEEDQPDRKRDVVLLSHGLWQRRFAGDPGVIGRSITLSGDPYTVIGVLPRGFHFAPLRDPDLFVTLSPSASAAERRYMHWMWAIARIKPGLSLEQVRLDLLGIAEERAREDSRWHKDSGLRAAPLREAVVGTIRPLLLGLLAAVAAVLLIACVNVANMLLARSAGRRREVAIRVALGAGRGRLIAQFLTESLLLALMGGAAGLLWAGGGVRAMVAAIPDAQLQSLPFLKNLTIHPGVLAFTLGVCVLTGVLFGIAPALRAADGEVSERLKEGARGSSGRLRGLFVVTEIGLALVLLTSAGLLTRSLHRLLQVSPGFETKNLLTARLSVPSRRYDTPEKVEAFFRQWQARIESLPGVTGVAMVDRMPMVGFGNTGTPTVIGRPAADTGGTDTQLRTVNLDYFRVMGIPLRAGRGFDENDRVGAPRVVAVNQAFVASVFPGEDPLGRKLSFVFMAGQPPLEIVGVVGDENVGNIDARARPVLYFPWLQDSSAAMGVLVRTRLDPQALVTSLRSESRALEPELLLTGVRTMEELIGSSQPTFLRRYPLLLLGSFAGIALALAAVGIYGVMSYTVSQRTAEIGIRMALGALPRDVLALVLKQGMALAVPGVAVGIVGGLAVARLLSSILFETPATDAAVFSIAPLVLTAVAAAACWIPARRAARVDPLAAVRTE